MILLKSLPAKLFQTTKNLVIRFGPGKKRKRLRRRVYVMIILLLTAIGIFSYLTNPFVKFSLIIDPYRTVNLQDGELVVGSDPGIFVKDDAFFRRLAVVKSAWHIIGGRFTGGPKAKTPNVDEIIQDIHRLRFSADEPFLISGDHFSMLYPRSLGIFYHSLLDPRTALDATDWQNRQLIYLKTLAYALQVYDQADHLSTTIVPVGPRSVALLNFYAMPSDTMYSLLFAFKVLLDEQELLRLYPALSASSVQPKEMLFPLATKRQAVYLLSEHKEALQRHYQKYFTDVYDPATGLIKTNITLSGTKDVAKRRGAFYDNVILWRTVQLAQDLGIVAKDEEFLINYKQRILQTYWLDKEGYFLEDLSPDGIDNKYYSSDWLITVIAGFLDSHNSSDLPYLVKSVQYIQRNAIDQPFGLQFHPDVRRSQLQGVSGWFTPAYGSTAIWSNWGMEYIKLLVLLYDATGDEIYLERADQQLAAYTFNIKRYQGYPEVYNKNGDYYRSLFYKSVRQTGWVVSYEQARMMVEARR